MYTKTQLQLSDTQDGSGRAEAAVAVRRRRPLRWYRRFFADTRGMETIEIGLLLAFVLAVTGAIWKFVWPKVNNALSQESNEIQQDTGSK